MKEQYLIKLLDTYISGKYNMKIIMDMLAAEGYCPELAHDGNNWFFLIGGIEVDTHLLQPTMGDAIIVGIEELIKIIKNENT